MAAKRSRRERPPSSSSSEEEDPQIKRIDCCPVLFGKNVDLASFTFDVPFLSHRRSYRSGTRPKTLLYGMILTKVFEHFGVFVHDSVALFSKATDTINISTLKRMKIFKEDGQWIAKSKGFDNESGPSTLPFEDGEEMDEDEDEPPSRPRSNRPSSSTSDFTFTEDHYNMLNGRIDSLTSTAEGLHNSMVTLQDSVAGMTSLLHALYFRLDAVLLPHLPPED
ncbi:Uncharacterized protein Adt_45727 [Abeliophyllum distichum]|uniref:Uncharacterized protein n=1 Tax=Abeliophyllum distichum TaxID=126358 RepID=A0ABD1PF72_9LAMI